MKKQEFCLGCKLMNEPCTAFIEFDGSCRFYENSGWVSLTKEVVDLLENGKEYLLCSPNGLVIGATINKWDDDKYFTNDWFDEIETAVIFDGSWKITFIPNNYDNN